jgi:hypothetical protein
MPRVPRDDAADAAQADYVLRDGIAQKAGAITRRGLIREELNFENWAAMTIYRALALNHLVFHADIRRSAICAMIVSRRPPHRCGPGDDQRGNALAIQAPAARDLGRWESRKTSFCGYCQIVLHRFDAFDLFRNSRCLC